MTNEITQPLPKAVTLKDIILKFKKWLKFLLSHWVKIVAFGLLGASSGFIYSVESKPEYTATLNFVLEEDKQGAGLGNALGLASLVGIDLGSSAGGAFSGANLIELMKSRSIVEKALLNEVYIDNKHQTLADLYINYNGWKNKWKNDSGLVNINFLAAGNRAKYSLQQDSVLGLIYESLLKNDLLVWQKDKKVSFIDITLTSKHELFAKTFVETLAREVSDFYIETKTKKSSANVSILQHQVDSIRNELNLSISDVASANDNTFNLNSALLRLRTPSQKRQIDVQANIAILTELIKNLELAKVTLRKETPLIQVIDRPILPLEKKKFGKVKGLLYGGIAGFFLIVFFLAVKREFKTIELK